MKIIITRYLPCNNVRGPRISASDGDNRIVVPPPDHDRCEDNHLEVAQMLCKRLKWDVQLIGGRFKKGMAFVVVPEDMRTDKKKG